MDKDTILQQISHLGQGFPREALEQAVARQEEIAPELVEMLRWTKENLKEAERSDTYIGCITASYLLAQFREPRAYRPLVDLFATPGDTVAEMFGDAVTESLPQILASVYDGDLAPLKALIENRRADEWVRGAALCALKVLVAQGALSRDDAMAYCASLLRGGLESEPSQVWNDLAEVCCNLHPGELLDDLLRALGEGLMDDSYLNEDDIKKCAAVSPDRALARLKADSHNHYIESAVEELDGWAMWEKLEPEPSPPPLARPQPVAARDPFAPARSTKVGRNDPCPCGSGRKYKHCCGRRA